MTIIEALNYLNRSIKSAFAGAIDVLIKHTFKVAFPKVQVIEGKVSVSFPEVQKVSGKVIVDFPKVQTINGRVETDVPEAIKGIERQLNDLKTNLLSKGVPVTNIPKLPTSISITNFPKTEKLDFSNLEKKLELLNESIKKLPTSFPEFPKFPDFPEQKSIVLPKSFAVDNLETLKSDDPKKYVPVRLTDGEEFYRALDSFVQTMSQQAIFRNAKGYKQEALVNDNREQVVEVSNLDEISISVDTSNLATKAKQDDQIGQVNDLTHTNTHTSNKEIRTYSESNISAENSYNGTLAIGATFTGVWTDCVNYSEVIVSVFSTKASATNGLKVEWSFDGSQVDGDDQFTISASSSKTFSFPCQAKYVRVNYTNNGTLESNLRIQTLLKRFASKGSSHRLKDNLNQEDDAIVTKSQIVGFTTGGGGGTDLINVKVNPSGALTVDATGSEVVIQETVPTDSTKVNPSLVLVYTGDLLTSVQKTIGGTTYTKSLSYTGDKLTSVSSWS